MFCLGKVSWKFFVFLPLPDRHQNFCMYLNEPFLSTAPQRIVSVVPSQTELLNYLQLEEETVGITRFCVHPNTWHKNKKRIGGTKDLHIDEIIHLQPDLIIANKEENVKEQIDILSQHFPVWLTDVNNFEDALQMIADIGSLTKKDAETQQLIHQIQNKFLFSPPEKIKTAYLIWKDPYMTTGGDTFISNMMERAGFENVFKTKTRYPSIDIDELKNLECELILLSTEPYPFKQIHVEELQNVLPDVRILLADGEMFSWYGNHMLHAPAYFEELRIMAQG